MEENRTMETRKENKNKEKIVRCLKFTECKGVNIPIASQFFHFIEIFITNFPKGIDFRRKV